MRTAGKQIMWRIISIGLLLLAGGHVAAQGPAALDAQLRARLEEMGLMPLAPPPPTDPALVALGEALFFDRILSGNRDTACATCHHPLLATGDALSLSLGTGNSGLGPERQHAPGRPFIPRNAPDIFDRGGPEWAVMFWDGRVIQTQAGDFITPAGGQLPPGLTNALAAQAMFPVTSPAEMRGMPGDVDIFGQDNELALFDDEDYAGIWDALMDRLRGVPGYVALFAAAYPDIPPQAWGFQHAANAIAAYEAAVYTFTDSPWDRYLAGDDAALSEEAIRGALLFYGDGGCYRCHGGDLMTDQRFHNAAVPQIGPGKQEEAPLDYGRGHETGRADERFAFRTPPLRNVALTGPWMHNGAYTSLGAAVRHMIDPAAALRAYDGAEIDPELRTLLWNDPATIAAVLETLDPLLATPPALTDADVDALLAFLMALTDPAAVDMQALIPTSVPGGLPVMD